MRLVDPDPTDGPANYDCDLLVIGGGSGGLSAAKTAAKAGVKVILCDYVRPSTQGTTWGLGGTCVNVGCIPKKLFHQAAIVGEEVHHAAPYYGWGDAPAEQWDEEGNVVHPKIPRVDWERLRTNIRNHICSLNWMYTTELATAGVEYRNAYATFVDAHTCELREQEGATGTRITARRILLATGGRPSLLPIPGAKEYCVTSDDLFFLPQAPGKTLLVGASYVALECAGFLNGLGYDVTVMMRSIPLRGFDQDMAGRVVAAMEARGVRFIRGAVPTAVTKTSEGKLHVAYRSAPSNSNNNDQEAPPAKAEGEEFDTVCLATGRKPEVTAINLAATGVQLHPESGKVIVDEYERTTVPHIYAIGDIIHGGQELTPVAILAGKLLAERLYSEKSLLMNYTTVPTTVFTPLEYGAVGLSEEEAEAKYGMIEVYHTTLTPLEWTVPQYRKNECYVKMIVNPLDQERVLGFHILAPHAGEIVQAVAVAIKCGATKAMFDNTCGIHPTIAEDMVFLKVTKSSGESATKGGC